MIILHVLLLLGVAFSFQIPMNRVRPIARTHFQMNLMDRMWRVVKSNFNGILKYFEDPEKILEQAVADMHSDLIRVRQSYAEVAASCQRMKRQKSLLEERAIQLQSQAEFALKMNNEDLAREALLSRQQQIQLASNLNTQVDLQEKALDKLKLSMTALEGKILEAKRQKDGYIARSKAAKSTLMVNDMLNSVLSGIGSNSMSAFENMKEKVESLEARAELAAQLSSISTHSLAGDSSTLDGKLRDLASTASIDQEIARLKNQVAASGPSFALDSKQRVIEYEFIND